MDAEQRIANIKKIIGQRVRRSLARVLKTVFQTARNILNNHPKLKLIIMPVVLRIPPLNHRIYAFVQSSKSTPPSVHLTARALEIYEDIKHAMQIEPS